ncbi:hypothetical protein Vretimale_16699 [Volvox reticuliferus]|uniref:Uncharacterized protein n=1 Tax=Volvox reticuliferus TaxID=1737510 RepID=A0A8J4GTK7_9CHLO|nr:hypothetical protein Vretifemale_8500 [Volvox reticuliferus]GIM13628.1 hypothetical protein Vretimale_16699 [Volvox reticuliferus]
MTWRKFFLLSVQLLSLRTCIAGAAIHDPKTRIAEMLMRVSTKLETIYMLQEEVMAELDEIRSLRESSEDNDNIHRTNDEVGCVGSVYSLDRASSFVSANETVAMNNGHVVRLDDILYGYDYVFEQKHLFSAGSWLGVQSQQDPWDLVAIQQILWDVKPKVIYDIGTNVGGSAILFAHIMSQYAKPGEALIVSVDPKDYTINWDAQAQRLCPRCTPVADNPLWGQYVRFVKARAVERPALAALQEAIATFGGPVLISVDGWHRYAEVLKQCQVLNQYVTIGSYIIVQDTKLDRFLRKAGPRRAVYDFLKNNADFEIDKSREAFLYSQHSDGYLRRIR